MILMLLLLLSACNRQHDHAGDDRYTCPMHPQVLSTVPGVCPVCAMDLVLQNGAESDTLSADDPALTLASGGSVVSSIKTIRATFQPRSQVVEAQGIVAYDTRSTYGISSRVSGRLEKLWIKYVFQAVRRGDKVAEIYSPELITAQRELLFILERDPNNAEMIQSAKQRLVLLGFSELQLTTLIKQKKVQSTFTIYSPYSGYVVVSTSSPDKSVVSSSTPASGNMNTMNVSTALSSPVSDPSQIEEGKLRREGSYITAGEMLFSIVDNKYLRVEVSLRAEQARSVEQGDSLELDFGDGKKMAAIVDFIQPFYKGSESFVKLWSYIPNGQISIGHLVTARIEISENESLWLPQEAVVDLGLTSVVFLKERGVFKPKAIVPGTRSAGWVEIRSGLVSSDEVAANAQFMADSESFIHAK